METVKEAMSSLSVRLELVEGQLKRDNTTEDIQARYSHLKENHDERLCEMEVNMKRIISEQNEVKLHLDTRISGLENQIQTSMKTWSEFEGHLSLMQDMVNRQDNNREQLQNHVQQLMADVDLAIQNSVKNAENMQSSVMDDKQVCAMDRRIGIQEEMSQRLSEKLQECNVLMKELGKIVKDNESTLETLSNGRERDLQKLQEIEYQMAKYESDKYEALDKVSQKCQEVETQVIFFFFKANLTLKIFS